MRRKLRIMMLEQTRRGVMGILEKHGYTNFSPDRSVVRVYVGSGDYGEGVAVHPIGDDRYKLCIRWGGKDKLERVRRKLGGDLFIDGSLQFSGLTTIDIDEFLPKVKRALSHLSTHTKA